MVPNGRARYADCAPLPESASRADEHTDLPKQPGRSQQPEVHVFFFAAPEIGTPERVRLVKPARTIEAAVRRDEHRDVEMTPMQSDPSLSSSSV